MYELKSTYLSSVHHRYIHDALEALNKSTSQPLPGALEKWVDATSTKSLGNTDVAVDAGDLEEKRVVNRYNEFLDLLENDVESKKKTDNEVPTHSLTYLLTYLLTHLTTYSLTHLLTHSLGYWVHFHPGIPSFHCG